MDQYVLFGSLVNTVKKNYRQLLLWLWQVKYKMLRTWYVNSVWMLVACIFHQKKESCSIIIQSESYLFTDSYKKQVALPCYFGTIYNIVLTPSVEDWLLQIGKAKTAWTSRSKRFNNVKGVSVFFTPLSLGEVAEIKVNSVCGGRGICKTHPPETGAWYCLVYGVVSTRCSHQPS